MVDSIKIKRKIKSKNTDLSVLLFSLVRHQGLEPGTQ
jgi:hypothetical protein